MNKQDYREKFKSWQKIIKFAPILESVGIPKTNFSQFMNGKDNSLSIEKLTSISSAVKNALEGIDI